MNIKMHTAFTLLIILWLFFSCEKNRKPPNIIFILTDDHAVQAISAYGSSINSTPNIDRLATEGIRFDNCFCTNAICAPSRAAILTGKFSHLNGVADNRARFDSTQMTFPKLLQHAGYQTAVIGKWHLKSQPTGFDYWNILTGQGHYYNPDFIEMGEQKNYHGYVTNIITDISLEWLEKVDQKKPFLLLYHHKAPHRNWMPDTSHYTLYKDELIPEPENLFDDYTTRSAAARLQEMTIMKHMFPAYDLKLPLDPKNAEDNRYSQMVYDRLDTNQRTVWERAYQDENTAYLQNPPVGKKQLSYFYQRYIKDYLRCVASVDENIGRLLTFLDENNLTQNTIVIYTSDQGFFLGEHGWFDKRFMYEEALRVPFIMRYPNEIKAGSINDDLVQNIDFAPTLLDFAGLSIPTEMQGKSARSLILGSESDRWRTAVYYHYSEYPAWHMVHKHYGIRTNRYKLLHFYEDPDAWEFYDLIADPNEMNNSYSDTSYTGIIEKLKTELFELKATFKDTLHETASVR